jgi:cell division septation protein DedD
MTTATLIRVGMRVVVVGVVVAMSKTEWKTATTRMLAPPRPYSQARRKEAISRLKKKPTKPTAGIWR